MVIVVSRTPLRISLGGGGTDLPFYSSKFGGSLITAAINKYVYIAVNPRMKNDFKLNYSETEIVEKVEEIKHPLIRESLKLLEISKPLEIHSMAEIASGTGLGSSFSFLVGLLNALYYYKGNMVSRYKLAEDASHITMEHLQEPCGKQDQYACAFGGINHLKICTNGRVVVSPVNISEDVLKRLEANLMLFFTGYTRSANEVLADQKKNAEDNREEMLEHYHEIKKIGEDSLQCLENGDLKRFGQWMNIHWESKRKLSDKMSNPEIDRWYELALGNGAIGGKIIGAGGGGFLMLYVEKSHERLKEVMAREGLVEMPFRFDFDGSRIVYDGKHF